MSALKILVIPGSLRSGSLNARLAATLATKKAEPTDHAKHLVTAIHAVLNAAIKAGGSSLRDYVQTDGELGYFQHRWAVYEHEGHACPGCNCDISVTGGIRRLMQGGRSTFYCPRRQR